MALPLGASSRRRWMNSGDNSELVTPAANHGSMTKELLELLSPEIQFVGNPLSAGDPPCYLESASVSAADFLKHQVARGFLLHTLRGLACRLTRGWPDFFSRLRKSANNLSML